MNFEYNSDKSKNNKNKHDIDFEQAKVIWNEDNIIIPALTTDEQRYMIIGKIKNKFYSCIFTMRGEKIRIISCRRSRPKEERMYHEKIY
ncbi:MAG: BrnT family toxin [Candidatus Omnitrophica bacterium]|nr:BrnT family toxin [Candidatus Omnitrophota bacterium]